MNNQLENQFVKVYSNADTMKVQILSDTRKVAGVYAFQNSMTNEIVYVGSSANIATRFNEHFNGKKSNVPLQRAFEKYGISAFNFLVLEIYIFDWDISIEANRDLLIAREQYLIDELNPRYNILKTAGFLLGFQQSEETRALMSAAKAGSLNPRYGKTLSQETRALISASKVGKTPSQEARALMSLAKAGANHPMFGKTHTEDTRALISANRMKTLYVYDAETNELITQYPGIIVARKDLKICDKTIKRYLLSGLPYRGMLFKYS